METATVADEGKKRDFDTGPNSKDSPSKETRSPEGKLFTVIFSKASDGTETQRDAALTAVMKKTGLNHEQLATEFDNFLKGKPETGNGRPADGIWRRLYETQTAEIIILKIGHERALQGLKDEINRLKVERDGLQVGFDRLRSEGGRFVS